VSEHNNNNNISIENTKDVAVITDGDIAIQPKSSEVPARCPPPIVNSFFSDIKNRTATHDTWGGPHIANERSKMAYMEHHEPGYKELYDNRMDVFYKQLAELEKNRHTMHKDEYDGEEIEYKGRKQEIYDELSEKETLRNHDPDFGRKQRLEITKLSGYKQYKQAPANCYNDYNSNSNGWTMTAPNY